MAESQVPYPYLQPQLQAIRASISEPRFATYLSKGGGHQEYAVALYLYNARVAKAFLFPLNVVEVTLRNAVDGILVGVYGENWHQCPAFRDGVLSPESLATLEKAIQRAGSNSTRDDVVATLTFDFWSNLFRPDYGALWRSNVNIAFPHLQRGESRQVIQKLVRPINTFRNRVAHHEPILDLNITDVHAKIVRLVDLRCKETAAWMRHYSTVSSVVRSRPKLDGTTAQILESKLDRNFLTVTPETSLKDVIGDIDQKHPAIICIDDTDQPMAAFTLFEAVRFIAERANELDGLVALHDHRVSDLLEDGTIALQWTALDEKTPLALAVKELQKPRIQVLVGVNGNSGKVTGAIMRSHRRY